MKQPVFLILISVLAAFVARVDGLTLDAMLQRTIDQNPEIQHAKLDLERATGKRLIFRAVAFPDVTVGVAAGDQGGHRAGEKANQPFGFAYGSLIQPIFNASIPAS